MIRVYFTRFEVFEGEKKHKIEHEKGLELLRFGLMENFQLNLTLPELEMDLKKQVHGKPFLASHPEIHFNISHCKGLAVCVFADSEVGADVERIGKMREAVVPRVLTAEEQEQLGQYKEEARTEYFYRFWTLKESYLKQKGTGFAKSAQEVSFRLFEGGEKEILCSDTDIWVYQTKLAEDVILSVCCEEADELEIKNVS